MGVPSQYPSPCSGGCSGGEPIFRCASDSQLGLEPRATPPLHQHDQSGIRIRSAIVIHGDERLIRSATVGYSMIKVVNTEYINGRLCSFLFHQTRYSDAFASDDATLNAQRAMPRRHPAVQACHLPPRLPRTPRPASSACPSPFSMPRKLNPPFSHTLPTVSHFR